MIPTTPHPLTPALPWVPSPFSQSRSIPDVGRFGHCPWTVWTSSFSLPALMITPAGLLPIFMPVLPLSSHILMEIPPYSYLWQGGGLPQGHSLYNSNRSQMYLPLENILLLMQSLCTPKKYTAKNTKRTVKALIQ